MKFSFIPISTRSHPHSEYPYDAPSTLVPSCRLSHQYSILRSPLPRNAGPSNVSSARDTPPEDDERYDPSVSLPEGLCFEKGHILYACEHDPYSPRLSVSEHSHCCRSESASHSNGVECRRSTQGNGTSSPRPSGSSMSLPYVSSFDNSPYGKGTKDLYKLK